MSRTLSRDCFEGAELHKVNSLISMCLIFSPLVAPVLGGYLTESFGWRSSYLFLSLFAIAVVITIMTSMVETLPATARKGSRATQLSLRAVGSPLLRLLNLSCRDLCRVSRVRSGGWRVIRRCISTTCDDRKFAVCVTHPRLFGGRLALT